MKNERLRRASVRWATTAVAFYPEIVNNYLNARALDKLGIDSNIGKARDDLRLILKIPTKNGGVSYPGTFLTERDYYFVARLLERQQEWIRGQPARCLSLLQVMEQKLEHWHPKTLRNMNQVGEAILHRCAVEFTNQVMFSYGSIAVWIDRVYGRYIANGGIKKALEYLDETEFFTVIEWGQARNVSSCTKIKIIPSGDDRASDDDVKWWLIKCGAAMDQVYEREAEVHVLHFGDRTEEPQGTP